MKRSVDDSPTQVIYTGNGSVYCISLDIHGKCDQPFLFNFQEKHQHYYTSINIKQLQSSEWYRHVYLILDIFSEGLCVKCRYMMLDLHVKSKQLILFNF